MFIYILRQIMIFGTQMVLHDYHHGILNRMFSQETITDVHLYLDCLNFNCCLVGNSNETDLSTLNILRSKTIIMSCLVSITWYHL